MTEEKKQKLATRIIAAIQPEIDKLVEERDAARTQVEWAKQRLSHLLAVAGDDGSLNADRKIKDLADTCYEAAHAMPQSEAIRFIVALFTSRKDGGDDILSAEQAQDDEKPEAKSRLLECSVCGNIEGAPYEQGDSCTMCGVGVYRAAEAKRRIEEPPRG